ncbi:DUF2190 family protein [Microbulbifer sp. A4B17]|uniref:DUF2190 family protein n=1 Tax=Microbulbifer sp. A4B17 TaxID=359370 RepID=UPI00210307C1|nr:DUF2190 family protein [Microbulbifer sp. A4B17]
MVPVGVVLGIAMDDIAVGEFGVIAIDGVFTVPKVSAAEINQGETLTWVVASGSFDNNAATAVTDDITGATAFADEDAGSSVTSLAVKFTDVPCTVKSYVNHGSGPKSCRARISQMGQVRYLYRR